MELGVIRVDVIAIFLSHQVEENTNKISLVPELSPQCNDFFPSVLHLRHSVNEQSSSLYGCVAKKIASIICRVCFIETVIHPIDQGCSLHYLGICFLDITRITYMNLP